MGLAIAKICCFASSLPELWAGLSYLLSFTCLGSVISCHYCLDIFFPVKELHILSFVILGNQTSSSQHVRSLKFCTGSVSAIENTMGAGFWCVQYILKPCYTDTMRRGGAEVNFAMFGWQFPNNISHHSRLLWICFLCSLSLDLWLFFDFGFVTALWFGFE